MLGESHGFRNSQLVRFFRARDPLVYRLSSGESLVHTVPISDGFLSEFPAKQDRPSFDLARKIEQANVEILDHHADRINFGDCVFGTLLGLDPLCLLPREWDDVEKHSALDKNAMRQRLLFGLKFLDDLLRCNGRPQQGFQHWKQGLRFVESKRAFGHTSILLHAKSGADTGESLYSGPPERREETQFLHVAAETWIPRFPGNDKAFQYMPVGHGRLVGSAV